jgi:hypothetical protein
LALIELAAPAAAATLQQLRGAQAAMATRYRCPPCGMLEWHHRAGHALLSVGAATFSAAILVDQRIDV